MFYLERRRFRGDAVSGVAVWFFGLVDFADLNTVLVASLVLPSQQAGVLVECIFNSTGSVYTWIVD